MLTDVGNKETAMMMMMMKMILIKAHMKIRRVGDESYRLSAESEDRFDLKSYRQKSSLRYFDSTQGRLEQEGINEERERSRDRMWERNIRMAFYLKLQNVQLSWCFRWYSVTGKCSFLQTTDVFECFLMSQLQVYLCSDLKKKHLVMIRERCILASSCLSFF